MKQCLKCGKEFPVTKKINGEWKSFKNRKYCLECSPYKQHNTRKLHEISIADSGLKFCSSCETVKKLDYFYLKNSNGELRHAYCKMCCSKLTILRQRKLKKKAVEYKGGKCIICGYKKYFGALEFHHLDPDKKDFMISTRCTVNFDKIKDELDKCICVCRNCHSEIEGGIIEI